METKFTVIVPAAVAFLLMLSVYFSPYQIKPVSAQQPPPAASDNQPWPPQQITVPGCGVIFGPENENTMHVYITSFPNIGNVRVTADSGKHNLFASGCTSMYLDTNLGSLIQSAISSGLQPDNLGSYTIRIPFTFYQGPTLVDTPMGCVYLNPINPPAKCAYLFYSSGIGSPWQGTIDLR